MCTGGALNLPAVLAGAVVAFLLLTLLIAGVIVGAVLLRRAKRKGKNNKKSYIVKMECEEQQEVSLVNESTAGNDSEWRVAQAAFHYEQHAEDLHYENIDIGGQGCRGSEEGNGIRSEEGHYDVVVAADNVPLNGRAGHGSSKEVQVQQDDQSTRDTPDAVYAVVDMSKKKKQEKTQGGASATTTQGADTEEQHYEWSSGFGQDWLGNVVEPELNHGGIEQASPSNEANETVPQSEPCNPSALYAVVDKSKKKKQEKTQGGASATTTQGADTEEQHYEWSNVMGQDWLGNVVEEHGEVGQESLHNDAWETVPESEPHNPGVVCVVVDKSKKENKEKKNSDPV